MSSYVYSLTNKLNDKIYVGKSNKPEKKRLAEHYRNKSSLIGKALRKYGKENFLLQILEECSTEAEAYEMEVFYIAHLRTKIPNGYNLNDGGKGGFNPSEETRRKLRVANLGKKASEETKERISASNKGRKLTEEAKQNMSKAQKGKRLTKEHKKKLSEVKIGKRHSEETKKKMSETHKRLGTKPPVHKRRSII